MSGFSFGLGTKLLRPSAWRALLAAGLAFVGLASESGAKAVKPKQPLLTLTLRIRVASCKAKAKRESRPVRSARWIERHLASTRRIFARHRVRLKVERDAFTPKRCVLLTRRHRHAMAAHAPQGPWATVLVTQRVRDLDVPSYNLMGVHWRYRGRAKAWRGRRYVLLTARGKPPVLAHELAHFLGLRHDPAGGNLMTPGPSDPAWRSARKPKPFKPRLTAKQGRRLRAGLRRLLASAKRRAKTSSPGTK